MRRLLFAALVSSGCHAVFGVEPDPVDARRSLACPPMYTATTSGTYWVGTETTSWFDAQQTCMRHASEETPSTHLVVLEDALSMSEVTDLVQASSFWIGLSDLTTEGTFRWVTAQDLAFPALGSPVWAFGQPDDAAGAEDCVAIDRENTRLLYDRECTNKAAFVCECDDHPVVESNYDL